MFLEGNFLEGKLNIGGKSCPCTSEVDDLTMLVQKLMVIS